MWKRFRKTLDVHSCGKGQLIFLPDNQRFAKAEVALKFTLPRSYRLFLQEFGAGELLAYYKIFGVGLPKSQRSVDIVSFNAVRRRQITAGERNYDMFEDPDLAARLIFFATTFDGDRFGWDPEEQLAGDRENAVILIPRSDPETIVIAPSFKEFVLDFCNNDQLPKFAGSHGYKDGPPRTFNPYCIRKKRRKA